MIFSLEQYKNSIKEKLILNNWIVSIDTEFTFMISKETDLNNRIFIDIKNDPFKQIAENITGTKYENQNLSCKYVFAPDGIYKISHGQSSFHEISNLDIFSKTKKKYNDEELRLLSYNSLLKNWSTTSDLLDNYNNSNQKKRIQESQIRIDLLNILAQRTLPKIEIISRIGFSGKPEYKYKNNNTEYFEQEYNTSDLIENLNSAITNEKVINEIKILNQFDQNKVVKYCCSLLGLTDKSEKLNVPNTINEFIDKIQDQNNLKEFIYVVLLKISPKKIPHNNIGDLRNKTIINPSIELIDTLYQFSHEDYNITYHIVENEILKERLEFYKMINTDFKLFEIEFNKITKIVLSNNRNKEKFLPKFKELKVKEFETYSSIEKTEEELIDFKKYFGKATDWDHSSFNNRLNCIKYSKSRNQSTEKEQNQQVNLLSDLIISETSDSIKSLKSGNIILELNDYIFQEIDENNFLPSNKIKKYLLGSNAEYQLISHSAIIVSNDYSNLLYFKKSEQEVYVKPGKFKIIEYKTTNEYSDEFIFNLFFENVFNVLQVEKPISIESKFLDVTINKKKQEDEINLNLLEFIPNSEDEIYDSIKNLLIKDPDFNNIIIEVIKPNKDLDYETKKFVDKNEKDGIYYSKYIFQQTVYKMLLILKSNEDYYILSKKNENKIQSYLKLFIDLLEKNEESFYKRLKLEFSHRYKNIFIKLEQQISSIANSNNEVLVNALQKEYWQSDSEERKIWLRNNPHRYEELLTAFNMLNHSKELISNQKKNLERTNEIFSKFSSGTNEKHLINQFIEDICSKNGFTNVILNINNTTGKSFETKTETIEACFENLIDNGIKYGHDFTIGTELNENVAFIHFENKVDSIIDEDTYNALGIKTIQNQKTSKIGVGLKLSFEFLRKNRIQVEKIDFNQYKSQRIFRITCKIITL